MHDSNTIILGNVTVSMSARTASVDIGYSITVPSDLHDRGTMVEEALRLGREAMSEQLREFERASVVPAGPVGLPETCETQTARETRPNKETGSDERSNQDPGDRDNNGTTTEGQALP